MVCGQGTAADGRSVEGARSDRRPIQTHDIRAQLTCRGPTARLGGHGVGPGPGGGRAREMEGLGTFGMRLKELECRDWDFSAKPTDACIHSLEPFPSRPIG